MGSSAYIVQLFNGVLDTDGASWLQLMNGFCSNTDIYDAKYAQDFAKMFCTYSDEEINQSVSDIKAVSYTHLDVYKRQHYQCHNTSERFGR